MKKMFVLLFVMAMLLPADSKPIKFTLGNWLWKPASNQALLTTSSPTFAGLTLSGGTASTLAYLNGSKAFTSLANGAGYLLNDGSGGLSWAVDMNATRLLVGLGSAATVSVGTPTAVNTGMYWGSTTQIVFASAGTNIFQISNGGVTCNRADGYIGLRNNGTYIYSDADGQIDQRKTTAAQKYHVYNTYTSGTNYERVFMRATATAGEFGTEHAASGSSRPVNFYVNGLIAEQLNNDADSERIHYGVNDSASTIDEVILLTKDNFTGASMTITPAIPAGCIVLGVTTKVTTLMTGGAGFTGYSVGDGTDVDRWGANLNPALNEQSDLSDCTITTVPIYAAATNIVITAVGNDFTAGAIRVSVHIVRLTATSAGT